MFTNFDTLKFELHYKGIDGLEPVLNDLTVLRISFGVADGTGKSFIVSRPAGALITFGIELTTIATVPLSP